MTGLSPILPRVAMQQMHMWRMHMQTDIMPSSSIKHKLCR